MWWSNVTATSSPSNASGAAAPWQPMKFPHRPPRTVTSNRRCAPAALPRDTACPNPSVFSASSRLQQRFVYSSFSALVAGALLLTGFIDLVVAWRLHVAASGLQAVQQDPQIRLDPRRP